MLTGHVPYEGPTAAATMLMHLTKRPVPPSQDKPALKIPVSVDEIVLRAMAMEVDQRYPSMKELEDALLHVLAETTGLTPSTVMPVVRGQASQRAPAVTATGSSIQLLRWHKLVLGGLVAALTVLGTLLVRWRYEHANTPKITASTPADPAPVRRVVWQIQSRPPGAAVVMLPRQTVLGTTPLRAEQPAESSVVDIELRLAGYRVRRIRLDRSVDEHRVEALQPERERPSGGTSKKLKPSGKPGREGRENHGNGYSDNDSLPIIK